MGIEQPNMLKRLKSGLVAASLVTALNISDQHVTHANELPTHTNKTEEINLETEYQPIGQPFVFNGDTYQANIYDGKLGLLKNGTDHVTAANAYLVIGEDRFPLHIQLTLDQIQTLTWLLSSEGVSPQIEF